MALRSVPRSSSLSPAALGPADEALRLRHLIQTFVRDFGLLVTKETPCGQPVAPSYAHALMVLRERSASGATTSQVDLVRTLKIDKSNIARMCARMERASHVVQTRDPEDARARVLVLTAKGMRLASKLEASSRTRFGRVIDGVPRARRAELFAALTALNTAVAALGEEKEA